MVVSRFNEEVCEGLLRGATETLKEIGFSKEKVDIFRVPGAFEIPVVAKRCALLDKYQGIICLGAVIKGETPHFDYICQAVSSGIAHVSLDIGKPVAFGVITTNTVEQALARSKPNQYNKGREAALTVVEMMDLLQTIGR